MLENQVCSSMATNERYTSSVSFFVQGNTWVAENLGTLIETLKEIGENIDMNEHCQILVRKTGDLFVRQKKGRRKRILQQALNKASSHGNPPFEQTDSELTSDDQ